MSIEHLEPQVSPQSWWRGWRNWLKLLYALLTGLFCCALAAFAPSEGPALQPLIPSKATLVVHVRDGRALFDALSATPAFQEAAQDPDFSSLLNLQSRDAEGSERKPPAELVRQALASIGGEKITGWQRSFLNWLVPPEVDGLSPYVGRESAIVILPPAPSSEAPLLLPGERARKRSPSILLFTRVSGVRGLAARLGIFVRSFKARVSAGGDNAFDLGGGLIAFGKRGAAPAFGEPSSKAPRATGGPAPLARVTLNAEIWKREPVATPEDLGIDTMKFQGVPDEVIAALLRPPQLQELFAIKKAPDAITLEIFGDKGHFFARGTISAAHLPPMPTKPLIHGGAAQNGETPMGEGFFPLDLRAGFLRYVVSEMSSAKGQRRWLARFDDLDSIDADLEQLWPAFGNSFYFAIENPPKESDSMGYALLNGSIPLDASRPRARLLLRDLARTFPDIRVQRARSGDRFIFESSTIFRPAISISDRALLVTSNAGPAIFRENLQEPQPFTEKAPPSSYFLRLDGERLAPTVEKGWVVRLDDLEERIGTREFMAQYPQPEVDIRLARKLSRLLGRFALEIQPLPNADAQISADWIPASIVAPDIPKKAAEEDVAAPPPL